MILAATDRVPDGRAAAVLARDEARRAAAIRHPRRRTAYVRGRILLRELAGGALALPPGEVPLTATGRPALASWTGHHASLTHAGGWSLAAVAPVPVGIDALARRTAPSRVPRVARTEAAERAVAALAFDVPGPLLVWAATEAALKAAGNGLTVPLARLRWRPAGPGAVIVDASGVEAGRWWVELGAGHGLVTALATPA